MVFWSRCLGLVCNSPRQLQDWTFYKYGRTRSWIQWPFRSNHSSIVGMTRRDVTSARGGSEPDGMFGEGNPACATTRRGPW